MQLYTDSLNATALKSKKSAGDSNSNIIHEILSTAIERQIDLRVDHIPASENQHSDWGTRVHKLELKDFKAPDWFHFPAHLNLSNFHHRLQNLIESSF